MLSSATSIIFLLFTFVSLNQTKKYSAVEDARIIYNYLHELNHAQIARTLVHQSNWASVGTISVDPKIINYPMVNVISVDDNDINGNSTGKIRFVLTDLDFTGQDWRRTNTVTFLFTDAMKNCQKQSKDPMEPTCARVMISGKVKEMERNTTEYNNGILSFTRRHPAARNWLKAHAFYLCELDIQNIFVLDWYGGPHNVQTELYYQTEPKTKKFYQMIDDM